MQILWRCGNMKMSRVTAIQPTVNSALHHLQQVANLRRIQMNRHNVRLPFTEFFFLNVGVSSSSRRVSKEKSKWSTWRNCTAINVTTCRHTRWEPWIKNEWNAVHSQTIPFKFPPINIQPETCTFVGGFSSNNHFWQAKHRRMVPSAFPRKRFALATRSRCSRSSAGNAIVKTIPLPTRTIFLLKKKKHLKP